MPTFLILANCAGYHFCHRLCFYQDRATEHLRPNSEKKKSFSQLGLESNHTGSTTQSLFFLEESCREKRTDTQTFSNFSNYFKRVLKLKNVLPASLHEKSSDQTYKYLQKNCPMRHNIQFLGHGQITSKSTTNYKKKRKSIFKLFQQTGSIWFQIGSYLDPEVPQVPIGSSVTVEVPFRPPCFY